MCDVFALEGCRPVYRKETFPAAGWKDKYLPNLSDFGVVHLLDESVKTLYLRLLTL